MEEDLLKAAGKGNLRNVEILISNGADVNSRDPKTGVTALHIATRIGNHAIVEFLLNQKADPNIKDKDMGFTPVLVASYAGHLSILQLLAKRSANLNYRESKNGYTALHFAAEKGHADIVKFLIENGADTHTKDGKGKYFTDKLNGDLKDYYEGIFLSESSESMQYGCKNLIMEYNEIGIGRGDFGPQVQATLFEKFYNKFQDHAHFKSCLQVGINQDPEKSYWTGLFLFDKDYTKIQNFQLAKEIIEKGIQSKKSKSSLVSLNFIMGLLYWRKEQKEIAKNYFEKAYKLSGKYPGSIPALNREEKLAIDQFMGNDMK
jgi:tetratricopeptide (TPR) repeat protein